MTTSKQLYAAYVQKLKRKNPGSMPMDYSTWLAARKKTAKTPPVTMTTKTETPAQEEPEGESEKEHAPDYGPKGTYKTLDEAFAAYIKQRKRPVPKAILPRLKKSFAKIYRW